MDVKKLGSGIQDEFIKHPSKLMNVEVNLNNNKIAYLKELQNYE